MKLEPRLKALAKDYFEQTEHGLKVVETKNSYRITYEERQKMIEYYQSKCRKISWLFNFTFVSEGIIFVLIINRIINWANEFFALLKIEISWIFPLMIAQLPIWLISRLVTETIVLPLFKKKSKFNRLIQTLKNVKK